ncbi:MAG: sugar ABC transporter permease [Pelagibacterium sp. SCN 64-44]|nr:MAG: sugar ABC transporter permease [Pelagibacterium sp. SCN 64-44]
MTAVKRFFLDRSGFEIALGLIAIIYLMALVGLPFLFNVLMSFQDVNMMNLAQLDRPFVGFRNYINVFEDRNFWLVVSNTAVFLGLSTAIQLLLGLLLALLFNQNFPGASYMRGLFLAAWITPTFATGQIWKWMLAGDSGVLNYGLENLGLISGPVYWLSDHALALYSIIGVNVWLGVPYYMLLISVALAAIPKDLYEAAALDGAGPVMRFFTITLPLLRSTLLALVALGMILTLQQFDLIASMTGGGPINRTNVLQYWSWQLSFQSYDLSSGSAVAALLLVVVVGIAATYVVATRSESN